MSVSYPPQDVADPGHRANGHPLNGVPGTAPDVASALSTAAMVALHAPSVRHGRSWHWRVGTERVGLYADRWRRPGSGDPASGPLDPATRHLMLSCGAALHHARVALRAMGYLPAVRRLPDHQQPDLIASVASEKPIPVTPHARELLRATLHRQGDAGIDGGPVPAGTVELLREVAGSEGAWLDPLHLEPATVDGTAADGRTGYALYGGGDRLSAWLRCGEALSAVWLAATARGLVVRPVGAVVDPRTTGAGALHPGPLVPYLLLRIGVSDTA